MKNLYLFVIACIVCVPVKLLSQDGTLDRSFGNNGTERTKINATSGIYTMAVYPDGKIISAGDNYLIRNKADGTPDSSFGKNGSTFDGNRIINDIIIQPDNKILAAANYFGTPSGFAVMRFLSNGKADNSFGDNGIAVFPVSANSSGIGLQSDGKIIMSGSTISANSKTVVVRFNANGIIDSTFGTNGEVVLSPQSNFYSMGIAIQSDDKIAVACNVLDNGGSAYVYRLNANGSIDNSFGTNGLVPARQLFITSARHCIAIQTDGKIVLGGGTNSDSTQFGIIRFLPGGQRDASFGTNGFRHTSFAKWFSEIRSLVVQADGKIVAAGSITDYFQTYGFAIARYSTDGSLDSSFGSDGKISDIINGIRISPTAVGLQADGKIIMSGYADTGTIFGNSRFAFVSRFNDHENAIASHINNTVKTNATSIKLFPNPVKDVLHVRSVPGKSSIRIANSYGVIVSREDNVSDAADINVASLLPGVYALTIISGNNITTLKFVKQ